jgi:5'-nucleotidase
MRFLLTNDDGIGALGLVTLTQVARPLGQVSLVAPHAHCSGAGHQVTTTRPLRLHEHDADTFAVEGWPVDCVRLALYGLHLEVDWVLSGINAGGNLGADVYISGTVAAAREAVLLGKQAIAFSHYKRREKDYDWPRVARWTTAVLGELLERPCPPGHLWNVNFPHLDAQAPDPEWVYCPVDPHPLPVSYQRQGNLFIYHGDYHARLREQEADVAICLGGRISISQVRVR